MFELHRQWQQMFRQDLEVLLVGTQIKLDSRTFKLSKPLYKIRQGAVVTWLGSSTMEYRIPIKDDLSIREQKFWDNEIINVLLRDQAAEELK